MTKKLFIFIPATLLIILAALFLFANYRVKTVVDSSIAELIENGDYQSLEYNSVGVEINGDIAMDALHIVDIDNNEYILENIRITEFDYFNATPQYLTITAQGIRFPAGLTALDNSPVNPFDAYLLSIMDADLLPVEFNYQYTFSPEQESRLESAISVQLPGSFSLTSDWIMKNIELENFNQNSTGNAANPGQASFLFQNADIPSATISLQDTGIVNTMLTMQGNALNITGDEYRQQLLTQLQTMVLFIPQQLQPLAQEFNASFSEFLEGGNTFHLSVTPEYGGNIQQLQGEVMGAFFIGDFSRISELLNLNIETIQAN